MCKITVPPLARVVQDARVYSSWRLARVCACSARHGKCVRCRQARSLRDVEESQVEPGNFDAVRRLTRQRGGREPKAQMRRASVVVSSKAGWRRAGLNCGQEEASRRLQVGGPRGEGDENRGVGAENKNENRLCRVEGVENEARHERSGSQSSVGQLGRLRRGRASRRNLLPGFGVATVARGRA